MEKRQVTGVAASSAIALGGAALWGGIANDIAPSVVLGLVCIAAGMVGLLILFIIAPKKVSEPALTSATSPVTQNHSGVGHNIHAGVVNMGVQPVALSDREKEWAWEFVLANGGPDTRIVVCGGGLARAASNELIALLDARGATGVVRGNDRSQVQGGPKMGRLHAAVSAGRAYRAAAITFVVQEA